MATITQQSIQDKAYRIAVGAGVEPHSSQVVDSSFITEDVFRDALRSAVTEQRFERSFSLTLTDGVVDLPDGAILSEMNTATIVNADDTETPTSFEKRYSDYLAAPLSIINYATTRDNALLFREAGADAAEFDGAVNLTCVALPDIPALLTGAIDIPLTLADRTAEILAGYLKGE